MSEITFNLEDTNGTKFDGFIRHEPCDCDCRIFQCKKSGQLFVEIEPSENPQEEASIVLAVGTDFQVACDKALEMHLRWLDGETNPFDKLKDEDSIIEPPGLNVFSIGRKLEEEEL